jgi:hypothetical protein
MRRRNFLLLHAVAMGLGVNGLVSCSGALVVARDVIRVIDDIALILDLILDRVLPTAAASKVKPYVEAARKALEAARATIQGAVALDAGQVKAAFAEFESAYAALHDLLASAGLLTAAGLMGASPESSPAKIPTPPEMAQRIEASAAS